MLSTMEAPIKLVAYSNKAEEDDDVGKEVEVLSYLWFYLFYCQDQNITQV